MFKPKQKSQNQVFRDPSVKSEECWRVMYEGKIVRADFNCRGAAQAHLDLLESGYYNKEKA